MTNEHVILFYKIDVKNHVEVSKKLFNNNI